MRPLLTSLILLSAPLAADEFFTLKGHGGPIMGIAVAPGGQIATASFDNSVGLWSDATPAWLENHRAAVNAVVFASDNLMFSAGDDFAVVRWNLAADTATRLEGHKGKVVALSVSPDRTTVASASWDGSIGLWPTAGGPPRFLTGHRAGINDLAFSSDGARLYSASVDGTIRLWDAESGTERGVMVKHGFGVNEIVLNEAAGWLAYGAVDGVTRIIEPDSGNAIADLSLDRRPILSMAADAAKAKLAVGDGQGFIMVLDTATWRITHDFRATDGGPIWALAFSRDGTNIHAGGLDDRMYSWPVATMDEFGPMETGTRSFLENPETLGNGERQFKRKCSICHALGRDSARRAGPTLYGLFGRRAGTVTDYAYSDTLDGSEIVWTDKTVDALFDVGPDHFIPGTKMPMQRIVSSDDRADLIAYLREAAAPKEN